MKKQILILAMLTIALSFSWVKTSFSQEVSYIELPTGGTIYCPPTTTLTCADGTDGTSPIPGQEYTYTISANSMSTVHWLVTDASNIMTAPGTLTGTFDPGDGSGDYLIAFPTGYTVYNNDANTNASISISWKAFNGTANEVLLVAYVVNETGCTDNIEVYRIIPQYTFSLDIAAILDDGTEGATECVGPVQSASYNGTNLLVEYGNNFIFFAVKASNWQDEWMPDLNAILDPNVPNSVITSVSWAYPDQAIAAAGPWNATTVPVEASHYASNANGFVEGECIIVRVDIDHALTENLIPEVITLEVDGEMIDPETGDYSGTYLDLENGTDPADPCTTTGPIDSATYTISPRPTITGTPAFNVVSTPDGD